MSGEHGSSIHVICKAHGAGEETRWAHGGSAPWMVDKEIVRVGLQRPWSITCETLTE